MAWLMTWLEKIFRKIFQRTIYYYRSGPIERDPGASFHAQNFLDKIFTDEFGFKIIGDSFKHLKANNCPQEIYGLKMKKLRDQRRFYEYCQNELLLEMSLEEVEKRAAFVVSRPAPEASGGTTSETVISWLKNVPKLVIIGSHYEGLSDNNSTFMIRMLTDRYSLVFDTEQDVVNFVRKYLRIFKQGCRSIQRLMIDIKRADPYVNNRPTLLWDERFEGKVVILYGRPGCGKDTQARKLQHLYGFKFFGSGVELRDLYSKLPGLESILGKGNLSIEIIIDYLITDKLIKLEKFEPIVFSGSPKKVGEAKRLMEFLNILKRKPVVIVIDINEELSRERISLRRNCDNCEESYCGEQYVENPICPKCDAPLTARAENMSKEAIEKIFSWYKTDVEAVIRFFEDMGVVKHVDGNRSIEEIFKDILEILKGF